MRREIQYHRGRYFRDGDELIPVSQITGRRRDGQLSGVYVHPRTQARLDELQGRISRQ